jgi:hypothetical protein
MSVFPEFIQHIHDMDMYVPGYNYEEMYNIMIYNLTHNIISTNNFVYTYAFMNQLYNYLEELLLDSEPEVDPNTNNSNNSNNLPINDVNIIDIHINEDNQNNQNQYNEQQNNEAQYNEAQDNEAQDNQHQANQEDNQNALQLFNNYIITTMNNHPMNNINYTNNTNMNNEFTYTNLVYYNNL